MELKKTPLIIAIAGKGGVGKTIVTTLIAKAISTSYKYKLLLIDADPTHPHLSKMVKLVPEKSLEKIRANLIDNTIGKKEDIQSLAETIDFKVYDAIRKVRILVCFLLVNLKVQVVFVLPMHCFERL